MKTITFYDEKSAFFNKYCQNSYFILINCLIMARTLGWCAVSGFIRVLTLGFRVFTLGFRVFTLGFRVFTLGFRVHTLDFRVHTLGFRVHTLDFRVHTLDFRKGVIDYSFKGFTFILRPLS